ncbi:hypothetical protein ABZ719_33315 [Streptomyces sp. NPDC006743]|uniref:hypothetical protein n=1 Tax=Streptomyces sp. NPDC006743 TaxID=3154480 RepID=UPI0034532570
MPETVTTNVESFVPLDPDCVHDAFNFIRAVHDNDFDLAGVLMQMYGRDLRRLLMDAAERVIGPVTALDDQAEELTADSFVLEAVGRILLEVLNAGDVTCTKTHTAIALTVIRFTAEILTEEGQDTGEVLAELQHAAVEQARAAYETASATRA